MEDLPPLLLLGLSCTKRVHLSEDWEKWPVKGHAPAEYLHVRIAGQEKSNFGM